MCLIISILFCIICCVTGNENPCDDGNFKLLHTPGLRGGKCIRQTSNVICDHYISDGWYKVLHEDDPKSRKLMETKVAPNFCGTSNPIWLNGTHPVNADGIVNRTVCVVGVRSYCDKQYEIRIKACGVNEYVYYLRKAQSCNEGYCFGKDLPCAKPNPCEPGNSKILHVDGDRSTSCKEKSMSLCDNTFNNEWYRVQKNGIDLKMPSTCVDQYSCGTKYPIYLSGSEPAITDKVVSRKACVNDGNMCTCSRFYNIQLRNCSTYIVYNLTSVQSCPERYCFGTEGNCKKEGEKPSNFLEYILAVVAGIVMLFIIASIVSYILYKKSLRIKSIHSEGKCQTPENEEQLKKQMP